MIQPLGNKFISEIQLYDKYARWIPGANRRETWAEVCSRVMAFLKQSKEAKKIPGAVWTNLEDAMLRKDVLPSMRIVQMAGPSLDRCNVGAYNPVAADTQVLTEDRGYVPIKELEHTTTNVLNKDGRWVPATFRSYGEQPVYRVVVRRHKGRTDYVVKATANHRWVRQDQTVVATADLQVGDRLPSAYAPKEIQSPDEYLMGIRHGIIFGDGTAVYAYKRHSGYNVRLCGEKAQLLPYFEGYAVSYPPSFNGEPVVYLYDAWAKTHDLKTLPTGESTSYILGFVRGLQATDGFVTRSSQAGLTLPTALVDAFTSLAARAGYSVASARHLPHRTNYGIRSTPLTTLLWDNASLDHADFLVPTVWKSMSQRGYRVVAVEAPVECVEVLCAHVPDTNTFTLARGLVTGNCAFTTLEGPKDLAELLYILMQGTGVGYSVERKYIDKWPHVEATFMGKTDYAPIPDTTEGWADAFKTAITCALEGRRAMFDYSQIRPEGEWLHTKGGRASGPEPLRQLLEKTWEIINARAGQPLRPIDVHRLATMCGSIVQVGGVRRAAELALFDADDAEMLSCKNGEFWHDRPELAMANNSVVATGPVSDRALLSWMAQLSSNGTGEPGIFRRDGAIPARRAGGYDFGTNPCGEIILRPRQFCNLSVAVARPQDTMGTLEYKVNLATILGTLQSCLTHFSYLGEDWKVNCEEERLLGVDITGACDCPLLTSPDTTPRLLSHLRDVAVEVNKGWAQQLGIPQSAAVTCNKPSGNSAQFLDTSSGIHARYAPYYVRRLRVAGNSPIGNHLKALGLPIFPEVAQGTLDEAKVWVVELPVKSPDGALVRDQLSAVDQLSYWLMWKQNWTEHNPSCTIYVHDDEWVSVASFLRLAWKDVGGLSFLPKDNSVYALAPYEEITSDEYEKRVAALPPALNLAAIVERVDSTTINQEYACTAGGVCEF